MTEETKRKRVRNKSLIIRGLFRFTDWIYKKATTGLFGRIFGCYTRENEIFRKSFVVSVAGSSSKPGEIVRKVRFVIAEQFEESRILGIWRRCVRFLSHCRLRLYGSFMLTFGIYTGLMYFFKRFIITTGSHDASYITFAIILSLTSIPLIITGKTFSGAVATSRLGHFIASDVLGIPEEKLEMTPSRHGDSYNIAIIVGIVAGTLTYIVNPVYILAAIGVFAALALVLTYPETGVLATLLFLPLLSMTGDIYLLLIVTTYTVSYILKLIRGKRIITFEIIDLAVLFFGILIAMGGAVSAADGAVAEANRMLLLLFGCFVAGNLMRTRLWQLRCALTVCFSGLAVSLLVIWQRAAEIAGTVFGLSFTIYEEGVPFFGNGDLLSAYLLIAAVIAFASVYNARGSKQKFVARLASLIILTALVLTGSLSGRIAAFIAVIVFFLGMSRRVIPLAMFAGVLVPTGILLAPVNFVNGLIYRLRIDTPAIYTMFRTWKGSLKMIWATILCGVGVNGFSEVYPLYAVSGFEGAADSGSLWLRILSDTGIVGLTVFLIVAFLFTQNCCEYLRKPLNRDSKSLITAGLAAVLGLLIQSLFCDIWGNYCIYFVFWIILAVTGAGIRSDRCEIAKKHETVSDDEYSASVDI